MNPDAFKALLQEITSAIGSRADFGLALAAFGLLVHARWSPLMVVALAACAGWLVSVAWGSLWMMGSSAVFGMALAWGTGLHPATMILGTAPGGITEMAITAKVLQLGVPVVTAFQVCRLVAVLLIVGPLFTWVARKMAKA